jgi:choline dehydrogenase
MTDYIIVGAGSAGCVLANRLTENPRTSVALLEAGGSDTKPEIHIPAQWTQLWQTEVDWRYFTEPQAHLHQRKIYSPRGKVLGGTSSLNAMMYIRGNAWDYDQWEKLGNAGWGFADVLPYFKKSENQERGASEFHGLGGLLNVADLLEPHPVCRAFVEAAAELGIPRNDDFNGARQEGVGLAQVNQKDGKRHSTAAAFLKPAMQRSNLTVETHAHVTRLVFEGKRVIGVTYIHQGAVHQIHAEKEVILCGGSINSPQILLLSGIGPAEQLRAHEIPVIVDLPGVGQNLQDHVQATVCTLVAHKGPLPDSSNRVEGNLFIKTRSDLPAPDLQMLFGAFPASDDSGRPADSTECQFVSILLRPENRGSLSLASSDPLAPPLIQPNYLDRETDIQVLIEGCKLARRIGRASALSIFGGIEIQPGGWLQTDDGWRAFIRETANTVFHPVGTCKMGSDSLAVVDASLQVHGVQGLRVADASVMPTIVSGNTNAPVIMIAEKAADLIKVNA